MKTQKNNDSQQLPQGFVSAKQSFLENLAQRQKLTECVDEQIVRWAIRLRRFAFWPYAIDDVFAQGYENFPYRSEEAPIIGITHKKLHDVFTALTFMAGRPFERFHDVTLVAQAGLFYGIYTYRDLVPDKLKRGPLVPLFAALSRAAGKITADFASSLHANPVFRDGVDLPPKEIYNDPVFAGPSIMKMDYSQFVRHAGKVTMASVATAQRDIVNLNRSFVIFPEGKYCHDGSVAPMQDLAGFIALRKSKPLVPVSLTYDELCPDQLGRITAFVKIGKAIEPPADKKQLPDYFQTLHQLLQENSVITASHLIAAALQSIRLSGRQSFNMTELQHRFHENCLIAEESGFSFDSRLSQNDFQEQQLIRFLKRKGSLWLKRSKDDYRFNEKAISKFAYTERTVDDIAWNANNIIHLVKNAKLFESH